MKRLILISAVTVIWILSWPMPSHAQKTYGIGALVADDLFVPAFDGFKKKMTGIGYIEGKNVRYDFNNANGDRKLISIMARKIVESKPDLIVTSSTTATLPVAKLTEGTNLPVVFLSSANPLALVKGYATSGNNLTGVSSSSLDIIEKQMELLTELAPKAKRVISLAYSHEANTNYEQIRRLTQEAAKKLGLTVVEILADRPEEIRPKLAALIKQKAGDALFYSLNLIPMREEIIRQATVGGILVIGPGREVVREGALATYTSDYSSLGAQGALLVDKILKGARPSDLPIEQPSTLKLILNLKAAKAIGLKIPRSILIRADEIFE